MADFSHRPGWWIGSDGSWHPPQSEGPRVPPGNRGGPPGARGGPFGPAGIQCEYRVARILRDALTDAEMIFSDRRVAGVAGNVDHIVVAASGVWVVDAKKRQALSYRGAGPTGAVMRLYCGRRDITFALDGLSSCASAVASLVRDPSVPLRPAMAVLAEQCSLATGLRLRLGKTFSHEGILICSPRVLVEQIRQPGPVGHDQVVRIGHRLDEAFAAR